MTDPEKFPFRIRVLLSLQRALWDMVTPELRGVTVVASGPIISGRLLYSCEPGSLENELAAELEAYVLADFDSSIDVRFGAQYLSTDKSRELVAGEEWVYLRREAAGDE